MGRLFHKTGAELKREVREGRLRVIREEDRVQRCEGNEGEREGKKVVQF